MKKIRVIAKVYDGKTGEYVQRISELPVADEVVKGIFDAMGQTENGCPIKSFGHGDTRYSKRYCDGVSNTPLRDQRRFMIDSILEVIETNGETGEEKCIGGWRGI